MTLNNGSAASMPGSFDRSFTTAGTAYLECGEGEPLLLVHGVGMRIEAWAPQIEALRARYRVIAVDMPGHGASAPLPKGSRLEAFVAWLGRFLDERGLERVNLAGHSMGALIGAGAVATFPQRISRLALLNGLYRRDPQARAAVVERADAIEDTGVDVEGPISRWFSENPVDAQARRLTRGWLSAMDKSAYATAYGAFARGDELYAGVWPTVKCSTLFLTGRDDPNSTPEMSLEMAAMAPGGYARIIEGHRHMVNLTAPVQVNRLLEEWLDRKIG